MEEETHYNRNINASLILQSWHRRCDVLVRAVTEAELLRLPLLVVTVTVYWPPGVMLLKVYSLASQPRTL